MILIELVTEANTNVILLGRVAALLGRVAHSVYQAVRETLAAGVCMRTLHVCVCYPPREVFLPMLGMGLGMRPLPMPIGLVLFPGKRLCVGDVGERRGSAVLGLAERFSGCVDPSSCQ